MLSNENVPVIFTNTPPFCKMLEQKMISANSTETPKSPILT